MNQVISRPTNVSTVSYPASSRGIAGWSIRLLKVLGGVLSFSTLALGGAFYYQVSGEQLGPGAILLTIPKLLAGSLAPYIAVAGAVGAALGVLAGLGEWAQRDRGVARGIALRRPPLGTSLIVSAGILAAVIGASYTHAIATSSASTTAFAEAFGADWQRQIPVERQEAMLQGRWNWVIPASPVEPRLERDLAYWTVPGTNRKLLADLWQPPAEMAASGLAFIYVHGGGYVSQDKGGPTETWFRHLTSQGHVVLDIAYRLIPETDVPGMQGDVKRAIAWVKRNAGRLGVDPNRVVLGGGSAGSHLALLAAYAPDHPRFTPDDVRGENLTVRGVVGYYTAGDYRIESRPAIERSALSKSASGFLTGMLERLSGSKIPTGDDRSRQFVGGEPDEWPELLRQVSPITHVGPNTPPTLQIVGEHDVYVAEARAIPALHSALQKAGRQSVLVELPKTDHAFDMFLPGQSPAAQAAIYDVDRFLALMALPWAEPN